VTLIPRKILFVYEEVVIIIELPEPAVKNIKMLVGEILSDHIDIVLIANLKECI
jgi:hypothetical protein